MSDSEGDLFDAVRCLTCFAEAQGSEVRCLSCGSRLPPPTPAGGTGPNLRTGRAASFDRTARSNSASPIPTTERARSSSPQFGRAGSAEATEDDDARWAPRGRSATTVVRGSSPPFQHQRQRSNTTASPSKGPVGRRPYGANSLKNGASATAAAANGGVESGGTKGDEGASDQVDVPASPLVMAEFSEEELQNLLKKLQAIQDTFVFKHQKPKKATKGGASKEYMPTFIDITDPPRYFVRQARLKQKGAKSLIKRDPKRDIFIFRDIIVVTKNGAGNGKRVVKGVISLSHSVLVDLFTDPKEDVNSFAIRDELSREWIFIASDVKEKRAWLLELSELIAKVTDPSAARLELGFQHKFVEGSIFNAAVTGNQKLMATALRHRHCAPNQKDDTGRCPIHYVVEFGHMGVLQLMLAAGKSGQNVDLSAQDSRGRRALDIAIDQLSSPLLELFFAGGIGVVRQNLVRAMEVFASRRQLDEDDMDCMTMLFMRAGRGAEMTNSAEEGTLLHRACVMSGPSIGRLINFLVTKRGMDPNARRLPDGDRPLHIAGLACNPAVVKHLLSAGAQPNAVDEQGNTALHLMFNVKGVPVTKYPSLECMLNAMDAARVEAAQELCIGGARIDIPNNAGTTVATAVPAKVGGLLASARRKAHHRPEAPSATKWAQKFPLLPKSSWPKADTIKNCELCKAKLKGFNVKKHRCNFCTQVVCGDCSKRKYTLVMEGKLAPKRVDDGCFNLLQSRHAMLDADPILVRKMKGFQRERMLAYTKKTRQQFVEKVAKAKADELDAELEAKRNKKKSMSSPGDGKAKDRSRARSSSSPLDLKKKK